MRILNHILGLLGLIGMRYTGKRVYHLSSLMYVPPYVLDSLSRLEGEADDQSKRANFDATHELEELLLEENPLKARKRKEAQELDQMSPETRMMEEQ